MTMKRRSFLGYSLGGLAALVFPEMATAATNSNVKAEPDTPWQWQVREAREMTSAEREKYMPIFAQDLQDAEASLGARDDGHSPSMSIAVGFAASVLALATPLGGNRIYARHIEIDNTGAVIRTATTTFFASEVDKTIALHSMGEDASAAATSRREFEARAGCTGGTRECRACAEQNGVGIITCCGGCAWAAYNWIAFSSCALILCSLCASQNCLKWVYACCSV
ncbi:MAG: hypothetical protein K0S37_2153 [Microbacterium sp.]|jgi:hypothetical protein|nr:hypothetical protein [Microbacterium sp.]